MLVRDGAVRGHPRRPGQHHRADGRPARATDAHREVGAHAHPAPTARELHGLGARRRLAELDAKGVGRPPGADDPYGSRVREFHGTSLENVRMDDGRQRVAQHLGGVEPLLGWLFARFEVSFLRETRRASFRAPPPHTNLLRKISSGVAITPFAGGGLEPAFRRVDAARRSVGIPSASSRGKIRNRFGLAPETRR